MFYCICKINNKEVMPTELICNISWLYYGDIKFRDTFVFKYTPMGLACGYRILLQEGRGPHLGSDGRVLLQTVAFCLSWP